MSREDSDANREENQTERKVKGIGVTRFDFDGNAPRELISYAAAFSVALDPTATVLASGGNDGIVSIGPMSFQ